MTVLNDFERLECTGIWQLSPKAQRRDVIVSVGEATLTFSDQKNSALAHWSLPAVRRINPGERPALFRPGSDSEECLELTDETMIQAIAKVQNAIKRRKPRPGRLRHGLTAAVILGVLVLIVFWLPGAMLTYTASVVPAAKRQSIGESLLANIQRLSGEPCQGPLGRQALAQLHHRLFGERQGKIVVVPSGIRDSLLLPGGIFVLNRSLLEDYEEADVVSGFLLAEDLRGQSADPFERLLQATGILTSFRLLTTGDIPAETLADYAETLVRQPVQAVDDQALLERFSSLHIPSSPYAYALDISGEKTINLIEADPVPKDRAEQILTDDAWVALQGICDS